jgi:hypothetical protein
MKIGTIVVCIKEIYNYKEGNFYKITNKTTNYTKKDGSTSLYLQVGKYKYFNIDNEVKDYLFNYFITIYEYRNLKIKEILS